MSKETDDIIKLIKHWKAFKEEGGKDFAQFGSFLKQESKPKTPQHPMGEDMMLNVRLGILFIYLERYKNKLIKKVMQTLPLRTIEEFLLLMYLEQTTSPRKSDFTQSKFMKASSMEKTAIFEMIKRLQADGFISEVEDPEDKRSKRIQLTPAGTGMLHQSRAAFMPVTQLLFANMSVEDKKLLLEKFHYLSGFHEHIWEEDADMSAEELVLKYL
ncbi:MarR family transcriptional regulator [Algivirga pacifica]|uniref:HTH marR-type domain-containing protein n=1 Tax=Algivirga pacifica TaxID=1162670 RepID=A0ABP9CZU0_9BACT